MCGLSGFIPSSRIDHSELENISLYMGNALLHRGPDAYGSWIEKDNRLVFSFRRLAIQDLSSTGNQPMRSMTNRYVIVFNGEIYNHLRIRDLLKRVQNKNLQWNGSSDTETILTAIECWGIEETLNHLHGMFAIAIFDKKLKKLTLARDRMGEKPLYYGVINGSFVFASELKALKKFPNFNNAVSKKSIAKFLQYNFVPAPLSIYENIFKLNPGALIEIDVSSDSFKVGEQQSFWSIDSKKDSQKDLHDNEHTIKNLERSLSQVVKDQMISDVPLGAFLSGGIDSSLIVALMQANSTDPIKTFTVGFEESKFDESFFLFQAYGLKVLYSLILQHLQHESISSYLWYFFLKKNKIFLEIVLNLLFFLIV